MNSHFVLRSPFRRPVLLSLLLFAIIASASGQTPTANTPSRAASALNHPNIITMYEIREVNSTPIIPATRVRLPYGTPNLRAFAGIRFFPHVQKRPLTKTLPSEHA